MATNAMASPRAAFIAAEASCVGCQVTCSALDEYVGHRIGFSAIGMRRERAQLTVGARDSSTLCFRSHQHHQRPDCAVRGLLNARGWRDPVRTAAGAVTAARAIPCVAGESGAAPRGLRRGAPRLIRARARRVGVHSRPAEARGLVSASPCSSSPDPGPAGKTCPHYLCTRSCWLLAPEHSAPGVTRFAFFRDGRFGAHIGRGRGERLIIAATARARDRGAHLAIACEEHPRCADAKACGAVSVPAIARSVDVAIAPCERH